METDPLFNIISEEQYNLLNKEGVFSVTGLRNFQIRSKFKKLRATMCVEDALAEMKKDYEYLQEDTILRLTHK